MINPVDYCKIFSLSKKVLKEIFSQFDRASKIIQLGLGFKPKKTVVPATYIL